MEVQNYKVKLMKMLYTKQNKIRVFIFTFNKTHKLKSNTKDYSSLI
jgi:hypothetical protein